MFERFTKDARTLVTTAVGRAEADGAARVDALHLLGAVVEPGSATGALDLLDAVDVAPSEIIDRVGELRRHAGLSDVDRRALRDLGIDVDVVVARAEDHHGEGALAVATGGGGPGDPRRRRRRSRWHVRFGQDAKRVLEVSLRQALDVRDGYVGSEHVLPALATVPGPAADVLLAAGASPDRLRRAMLQRRKAA
ncbi:Clp amino terminal domain-containing protein, pathogenicity island component [Prauserella alba]|nr:Clp amino terminal domain-containing protein, pathogenicity island component [Prauserella alba]